MDVVLIWENKKICVLGSTDLLETQRSSVSLYSLLNKQLSSILQYFTVLMIQTNRVL